MNSQICTISIPLEVFVKQILIKSTSKKGRFRRIAITNGIPTVHI
jgi:hypothetical protein